MIYVFYFIIILICIIKFDVVFKRTTYLPKSRSKILINRKALYWGLFLFMLLYTALSYRVGSDIGRYMYDFDRIKWLDLDIRIFSLSDRQPLWILFQLLSKSMSDSFVLFRLLSSSLVLYVFFKYIYNETRYIFSSLMFFFILMSFDINFNILRQALAISSFIIACTYLNKSKYLKSYIFIIISVLFHNSAFVLFVVPILCLISVKKYFHIGYFVLSLLCISILYLPQDNIIFNMLFMSSDETIGTLSDSYLNGEYGMSSFSIVKILIHLLIFYFISKYYIRSGASNCDMILLYLYIFFFIVSSSIPIMGRIKYFFSIYYIIAVPKAVFYFLDKYKVRNYIFVYLIIISILLFNPTRYYFIKNPRINAPNGVQYYPYYSIFDKQVSPAREKIVEY